MAIRKVAKLRDVKTKQEQRSGNGTGDGIGNRARKYPKGVEVLSSKIAFEGPLFNVQTDEVIEPGGKRARRDVVRHGGSIVVLAVDDSESKRDPLIIVERQYRHAAGQYLYELPAGKLEPGEDLLKGAKRELLEETGYKARRWSKLVRFYASPGFLGEWMQVYLAEELMPGEAQPEDDEMIKLSEVPLSELLRQIEAGRILDAKTIASVLFYDRTRKDRIRKARARG
jgi:ADP-ribose pyrophosphatase